MCIYIFYSKYTPELKYINFRTTTISLLHLNIKWKKIKENTNEMEFWLNGYVNNYSESTEKTLHLTAEIVRANGVEAANYE